MFANVQRSRPTRGRMTSKGLIVGYNVQPIREISQILAFQEQLLQMTRSYYGAKRNVFLFQLGINTGLRITDILWLRVLDVKGNQHMVTRELKTGKIRTFLINTQLREIIDDYIRGMKDDQYLFASNRWPHNPITRHQAYRILRKAGEGIGLDDVGCHTLRKTFGYHHYRLNRDIALLMMIFNHTDQWVTLRYIGWSQELMDASIRSFFLGSKM